jgi:hypothetical protein
MNYSNNEEDEANSENEKITPSILKNLRQIRSKENSFEHVVRSHSLREDHPKEFKEISLSFHLKEHSGESSDQKVSASVLCDRSNGKSNVSLASRYIEYLDHYKKNINEILKKAEMDDLKKDELMKTFTHITRSDILLNSTILSHCFGDRSFADPIHEISNEADFIEEDSEQGSFFQENPKDEFSKIAPEYDREDFSFGENNPVLSGIFDDLQVEKENNFKEDSFEELEKFKVIDDTYFFTKDPTKQDGRLLKEDPHEEHITISIKNLLPGNLVSTEQFVLTSKGIVGSDRNTLPTSVIIGRLGLLGEDIRPNDIVLASSDTSISRVHCALFYKHVFKKRKISLKFLTFLSGKLDRVGGPGCPVRRLNPYCLKRIYEFLKPSFKLYAIDLGSTIGTFKRLVFQQEHPIERGEKLMIGNTYNLNVNYLTNATSPSNNIEQLYHFLSEEAEEKMQIHGLDREQLRTLEAYREKKKNMINEILKQENESFTRHPICDWEFPFPILILEFEQPPSNCKTHQ